MIESAEEFVRLRSSDDPVEYRRAAHESAPIPVWLEVVERFPEMRCWVAHNKSIPLEVLARLATDDSSRVRSAVATKRKLSRALFEQLATDCAPEVRQTIARNRKTPRDVLETLAADPCDHVAELARARLAESRDGVAARRG